VLLLSMFTVAGTGCGDDSGNSRCLEAEEEADPEASPVGGDIAVTRLLFLVAGRRHTRKRQVGVAKLPVGTARQRHSWSELGGGRRHSWVGALEAGMRRRGAAALGFKGATAAPPMETRGVAAWGLGVGVGWGAGETASGRAGTGERRPGGGQRWGRRLSRGGDLGFPTWAGPM
jgi:hypothetical protein